MGTCTASEDSGEDDKKRHCGATSCDTASLATKSRNVAHARSRPATYREATAFHQEKDRRSRGAHFVHSIMATSTASGTAAFFSDTSASVPVSKPQAEVLIFDRMTVAEKPAFVI